MNWLMNVVVVVQILAALVMIGLVLVQHGKGADMGASFGSGASGSLFGATGSANFLSRSTAVCAAVFFCCTLALAFMANDRTRTSAGSVLDRPLLGTPAASAPLVPAAPSLPASGSALIPGAGPATAPAPAASSATPVTPAKAPAATASGAAAIPTK